MGWKLWVIWDAGYDARGRWIPNVYTEDVHLILFMRVFNSAIVIQIKEIHFWTEFRSYSDTAIRPYCRCRSSASIFENTAGSWSGMQPCVTSSPFCSDSLIQAWLQFYFSGKTSMLSREATPAASADLKIESFRFLLSSLPQLFPQIMEDSVHLLSSYTNTCEPAVWVSISFIKKTRGAFNLLNTEYSHALYNGIRGRNEGSRSPLPQAILSALYHNMPGAFYKGRQLDMDAQHTRGATTRLGSGG